MQPIILIAIVAIVAIAAVGMSSGFLFGTTTFNLIAQDLGAKETELKSPIDTAKVDFRIERIDGVGLDGLPAYKNRITKCSFHSPDDIPRSGVIICKLTHNNNIVAEGRLDLTTTGYSHSDVTYIKITNFAYNGANDAQNINDVKIVVLGKNPSCDYLTSDPALPDCKTPLP